MATIGDTLNCYLNIWCPRNQ